MSKEEILYILKRKLTIWNLTLDNHKKFIEEKHLKNNYRALDYLDEICNEIVLYEELITLVEESL